MTDMEELSLFFKKLAERYLDEMYSLKAMEKRFAECSVPFTPIRENAEDLQFLELQNRARIERLDGGERETLTRIYQEKAEAEETVDFLKNTIRKVLAGDLRPGADYEYFPDIYGRGILPGQALVFCFRDKASFDAGGRFDSKAEKKKERIFNNVKRQFEHMVEVKSGTIIRLVRI